MVKRQTGYAPSAHLKGTLHQKPHVKSEDLFFGETSSFGKCLPLKKLQAIFVRKTWYPVTHLALITLVP